MTDDTIHRTADVVIAANNSRIARYPQVEPISMQAAREYAEALHAAGLLAPAPLREEWGVRWQPDDQGEDIWDHYLSRSDAERGAGDEGEAVRRYLSDWEPADRAEGDGTAET